MVTIIVNGVQREIQSAADTPLLYVLRNDLGLSSPQFGCGLAQCGSCSVLLEGKEIRSCITPVSAAAGKAVVTLEGLPARWAQQKGLSKTDAEKTLHPVQQAWIEEDVPQCGYCQSGQIMSAASLLTKTSQPSDADIDEAMRGNICRCGTYNQIRKALHRAAQIKSSGVRA